MKEDIEQMLIDTFKGGPSFSSTACTTAVGTGGQSLTLADLEAVAKKIEELGPEPIAEWMRNQGCPPGLWVAILPQRMKQELPFWPEYVRFSSTVDSPVLARRLA